MDTLKAYFWQCNIYVVPDIGFGFVYLNLHLFSLNERFLMDFL